MLLPAPTHPPRSNVAVLQLCQGLLFVIVHLDKVNYWGTNAFSSHTLKTVPHIAKDVIPHDVEDPSGSSAQFPLKSCQ